MAKLNAASFFGITANPQSASSGGSSTSQTIPTSSFNPTQLIQIINEYQSILTENKERTKVDVSLMRSIGELMSSMSLITSNLNSLKKTVIDHLKSHSSLLKTKKPKPSYASELTPGDADRPGGWTKSPEKMSSMTSPLGDISKTTGLIAAATAGITAAISSLQLPSDRPSPDVSSAPGEQKLAAFVATLESSGEQNQADVLQSMYNRAGQNYSGFGGLFGQLTQYAQYSPLSAAIHDTPTGDSAADKKYGKIRSKLGNTPEERISKLREIIAQPDALSQLQTIFQAGSATNAAKILDDALKGGPLSQKSKDFIKGRTDFGAQPGAGGATGQTIRRGEGGNYFGQNGSNIPASPPPASSVDNLQTSSARDLSGEDVRVALSPTSPSSSITEPQRKIVPDLAMDATGGGTPSVLISQAPPPTPVIRPELQTQNSGSIQPIDPRGSSIPGALCLGSYCALS